MASHFPSGHRTASVEDIECYEVIDGVRLEREPIGAFETVLASWLCFLINGFAAGKKLGLAVNEVLVALNASRDLKRRPDVAFVSYGRWPSAVVARTCLECRAGFGGRNRQSHQSR